MAFERTAEGFYKTRKGMDQAVSRAIGETMIVDMAAAFAERSPSAVLEALKQSKAKVKGAAELSILLTNDEEQHELNKQWRGKDSSTNVLSFPMVQDDQVSIGVAHAQPLPRTR